MTDNKYEKGLEKIRSFGSAAENVLAQLETIFPDIANYTVEHTCGDIYQRPGLDVQSREMIAVAVLIAQNNMPFTRVHAEAALRNGVTVEKIKEIIVQVTSYAGWAVALNATLELKDIFEKYDTTKAHNDDITDLILEDYPYVLPFDIIEHSADGALTIGLPNNQTYFNSNFGELLQLLSTAGSYCVALKTDKKVKQAFLGYQLGIKKHNAQLCEKNITCTITPILDSAKSAKCVINVFSESQLLYSFDLLYTIFPERVFKKLFKDNYQSRYCDTNINKIPKVSNTYLTTNTFTIDIEPFDASHCLGHFTDYPIIPSVRIFDCLLAGTESWMKEYMPEASDVVIDSVDIFQNSAMSITSIYRANVTAKDVSNNTLVFLCTLVDTCENEYGHYILRIKYD